MTTQAASAPAQGSWQDGDRPAARGDDALCAALRRLREPFCVVEVDGDLAVASRGAITLGDAPAPHDTPPVRAYVPALGPERLGDPAFLAAHNVRHAYVAGEMANGIASTDLVIAMGRAGMLGFFGAAGLTLERVDAAISRVQSSLAERADLGDRPFGFNLIHSPSEPALEAALADLYVRRGVRRVCASAYLDLTLPVVRYRTAGIRRGPDGAALAPNRLVAKISRVEVARRFLEPPPEELLAELVRRGDLTAEQSRLARTLPLADDVTAEADSGGHTDNRPAIALIPTMIALRDEIQAARRYPVAPRIGAAGGIATPASAAGAFAMGAAYVSTGSINQASVEAATSPLVKEMLAQCGQADVAMAPAADMFEMGVKVQVLKFGTMFAVRAKKLYDLYREHESLDALPEPARRALERDFLRSTIADAWAQTRAFFETRGAPGRAEIDHAERDPKHKMALIFRSYLGQASKWAIAGTPARKADFQVWCGPAMGAFNEWARGSFLERPEGRHVEAMAMNVMAGAAYLTRVNALRAQGVPVPPRAARFQPQTIAEIDTMLSAPRSTA